MSDTTPEQELELVPAQHWDGPLLEATGLVAGYVPEVDILRNCNLALHQGCLLYTSDAADE